MNNSTALIVYPPARRFAPINTAKPAIFLAGSIEMGVAVNWQDQAIDYLQDHASVIYNPRRPNWDPSWEQKIDNTEFNVQVNWELDMLGIADFALFYFDPATKSPITLMELGTRLGNTLVCCPEGYWRKGNVDIFCERCQIPAFSSLEDLLFAAKRMRQIES